MINDGYGLININIARQTTRVTIPSGVDVIEYSAYGITHSLINVKNNASLMFKNQI